MFKSSKMFIELKSIITSVTENEFYLFKLKNLDMDHVSKDMQ
jgi:hypothetical protein